MNLWGGDCQRVVADVILGYSEKVPSATGKSQSYLVPISGSMQEPIEGRSERRKTIGGGSLLVEFQAKPMQKNQEPSFAAAEARSHAVSLNKGAIEVSEQQRKKELRFDGCQNEFCCVHVHFGYDVVREFFGFAKHVFDDYVAALGFGVNHVFKLGFTVDYYVEFAHSAFTNSKWIKTCVISALHGLFRRLRAISNNNSRSLIPINPKR